MKKHNNLEMFLETDKKYLGIEPCPLPFILYTVGHAIKQPATKRPFGYEAHQILWVEKGSGVFTAGDETFTLNAGEGFFSR